MQNSKHMKIFKAIIFSFLALFQMLSCDGQQKIGKNPENLEEGISYFQKNWTENELNEFKNKSEAAAIASIHFGAAMWVRNNWIRGDRNEKFYTYFKKLGINNPDDISAILFTSLHRRLNGKNIELDSQIKKYKEYWKVIELCKQKIKNKSAKYSEMYAVGDTITILMPVLISDDERNAVLYNCPDISWDFNDQKDLKISAQIVKKYHINSQDNVFFTLKILEMNYPDTDILGQSASKNAVVDLNLDGLEYSSH